MLYAISLIPILLYVVFVKAMDAIALTSWRKTLECLIWGIATCLILFLLAPVWEPLQGDVVTPLAEELLKALPLAIAVHRNRSAFFAETLAYGAAIGAGFALLENTLYIYYSSTFTLGDAIIRGFGTALLHMGCTALLGCMVLLGTRLSRDRGLVLKGLFSVLAVVPSWGIHFAHNFVLAKGLLPEFVVMLAVVVVIMSLFLLVYELDSRLIHKWLDMCIANDIALYKAIKGGHLKDTNAGQYLIAARDRFRPEMFFDILMYLQLFLEITIAAKSRMIMKDAGIDLPLSEEEHLENQHKVLELTNLSKMIGKAGERLLSPIVNLKATDDWAMKELL